MVSQRRVVAVDGLAGSGKTTLSSLLAKKLGYIHFSSGMIYRTLALASIRAGLKPEDEGRIAALAHAHKIELRLNQSSSAQMLLNGEDVTPLITQPEVSEFTSKIATLPQVRQALVPLQRDAFPGTSIIADGRDLGTVIFPDAIIKFYVEVSQEIRIQRRLKQLYGQEFQGLNSEMSDAVKREVIERDRRDQDRDLSPAIAASDAVIIDNSSKTLTEVVDCMYHAVLEKVS